MVPYLESKSRALLGYFVMQPLLKTIDRSEISLDVKLKTLLGCYSDPKRDSRMHTVSPVYIAEATGEPVAADDAANVQTFTLNDLPETLAFDHEQILNDYRNYLEKNTLAPLRHV